MRRTAGARDGELPSTAQQTVRAIRDKRERGVDRHDAAGWLYRREAGAKESTGNWMPFLKRHTLAHWGRCKVGKHDDSSQRMCHCPDGKSVTNRRRGRLRIRLVARNVQAFQALGGCRCGAEIHIDMDASGCGHCELRKTYDRSPAPHRNGCEAHS